MKDVLVTGCAGFIGAEVCAFAHEERLPRYRCGQPHRYLRCAILNNGGCPTCGDGTQGRDFTFVEDIARGTVLALRPVGYELINLEV